MLHIRRGENPDDTRKRKAMTTQGFTVSHARDAHYERGLRSFFEYRDLGIAKATKGQVVAHLIRAAPGPSFAGPAHLHRTAFQFVYVLKGWIDFDYEGHGTVRLEAGASVYQPPSIRHRELAHSDDLEMLEIVMPADFSTEEVASVLHDSVSASTTR
jgi:quercetin dioxygenase-like cupin family protein